MPMTRISLLKGKSTEYLRAISDSLHQALVEAFKAPGMRPEDVMVVINTTQTDEWSFSAGDPVKW
jgi:phenylpyruvate tautomerase PptA (4-oxalocrotonate tautomerase family)